MHNSFARHVSPPNLYSEARFASLRKTFPFRSRLARASSTPGVIKRNLLATISEEKIRLSGKNEPTSLKLFTGCRVFFIQFSSLYFLAAAAAAAAIGKSMHDFNDNLRLRVFDSGKQ